MFGNRTARVSLTGLVELCIPLLPLYANQTYCSQVCVTVRRRVDALSKMALARLLYTIYISSWLRAGAVYDPRLIRFYRKPVMKKERSIIP